jgi:hypothetical protein
VRLLPAIPFHPIPFFDNNYNDFSLFFREVAVAAFVTIMTFLLPFLETGAAAAAGAAA